MSGRARQRLVGLGSTIAFCAAAGAYAGIVLQARAERSAVTDWLPYGARLGSEAVRARDARAYPGYGFEDVGDAQHRHARATWLVDASEAPQPTDFLYVAADEPLMYARDAEVSVSVAGRRIGSFRQRRAAAAGPFAADAPRTVLYVPPERTPGYAFELGAVACRSVCVVTVDADAAVWRIYRLGFVHKTLRFASGGL